MKKTFACALLAFALPVLAEEKPLIANVPALAHASQAEVEQRLGKAEFCRKASYGLSCRFTPRGVEVAFVDGKAERIVINDLDNVAFDKNIITQLGFQAQEPNEVTEEVMRWTQLPGIAEVSVFPFKESVDHALILVTSRPEK